MTSVAWWVSLISSVVGILLASGLSWFNDWLKAAREEKRRALDRWNQLEDAERARSHQTEDEKRARMLASFEKTEALFDLLSIRVASVIQQSSPEGMKQALRDLREMFLEHPIFMRPPENRRFFVEFLRDEYIASLQSEAMLSNEILRICEATLTLSPAPPTLTSEASLEL